MSRPNRFVRIGWDVFFVLIRRQGNFCEECLMVLVEIFRLFPLD